MQNRALLDGEGGALVHSVKSANLRMSLRAPAEVYLFGTQTYRSRVRLKIYPEDSLSYEP